MSISHIEGKLDFGSVGMEALIITVLSTLIVGILFVLLRLILRGIYRLIARPKINLSYAIEEASAEIKESTLFPTKKVGLWIESKTDIDVNSITFKRVCEYQKHCLLYRFFFGIGVLRDRAWCSFANVNDWTSEGNYGFAKSAQLDKETINELLIDSGELTLTPYVSILNKGTSTQVDIPFRLSCERPHTILVTVYCKPNLKYRARALRVLKGILNAIKITNIDTFGVTKSVNINWDKSANNKIQRESNDWKRRNLDVNQIYIGSSYRGMVKTEKAIQMISILNNCISRFITKSDTPSEMKANEIMKEFRRETPNAKIVLTISPQKSYRILSKERVKELTNCWITCRDFSNEFLNCTNYAALFKYFDYYLIFFPTLLANTFRYLCIKGHSTRVDLLYWLAHRKGQGLSSLMKFTLTQLSFLYDSQVTCHLLKSKTDKQAKVAIKLHNAKEVDKNLADELLQSLGP